MLQLKLDESDKKVSEINSVQLSSIKKGNNPSLMIANSVDKGGAASNTNKRKNNCSITNYFPPLANTNKKNKTVTSAESSTFVNAGMAVQSEVMEINIDQLVEINEGSKNDDAQQETDVSNEPKWQYLTYKNKKENNQKIPPIQIHTGADGLNAAHYL